MTDVVMPGAGGPELYDRLRAAKPSLKVLFMSASAVEAVRRRGLPADAPCIEKPFKMAAIAHRVRRLLDGREGWGEGRGLAGDAAGAKGTR